MEKIKLSRFDVLGFIDIKDNAGVENLTTPLSNGQYLSRNMLYYSLRTYNDCCKLREYCRSLANNNLSTDKLFVVYENMLNCSAKVFYAELQKKINGQDNNFELCKICFEQDCYNLLAVISGNKVVECKEVLPNTNEKVEERQIELDNKGLLALFCSKLNTHNKNIILTGMGGLYLGAFCKVLYGTNYSIAPLSSYVGTKDLLEKQQLNIEQYLSEPSVLHENKDILFLDDNIGTGSTMRKLVALLEAKGKDCQCGAVQYNWINYYKVETGEKSIDRFSPNEITYLTKFNYPGVKLLKHAISEHLVNSGDDYVSYIKSKSYRKDDSCDILTLARKGEKYAKLCGVDFEKGKSAEIKKKINNKALDFLHKIDSVIEQEELKI